ncbi:hypothetical protein [Smaragdicoccus niigatensis]|uniref:hypothetical protein n=1 Tax=Smaragdicoccus niigatensis TaxID=359359 RepID=UPI00037DC7FE|nr:hypothetical protein [Smaragdicoccus niigatensis]
MANGGTRRSTVTAASVLALATLAVPVLFAVGANADVAVPAGTAPLTVQRLPVDSISTDGGDATSTDGVPCDSIEGQCPPPVDEGPSTDPAPPPVTIVIPPPRQDRTTVPPTTEPPTTPPPTTEPPTTTAPPTTEPPTTEPPTTEPPTTEPPTTVPPPPNTPTPPADGGLHLAADSVSQGGNVQATGRGCAASAPVTLTSDGHGVGATTSGADGSFTADLDMSSVEVGQHMVIANCGAVLSAPIDVYLTSASNSTGSAAIVIVILTALCAMLYRPRFMRPTL